MGGQQVIVLDTHIWVWWANDSRKLSSEHRDSLQRNAADGLGVSVISCWEVAKLVEKGRLKLDRQIEDWIESAVSLRGLVLLPLTPEIAVESTMLPSPMHSDPADQLIVATARVLKVPLLTADSRLLAYPHVVTL
jgi:PIN domain nuclease of toxin-antitoxin system